jgi:hypothetical protein
MDGDGAGVEPTLLLVHKQQQLLRNSLWRWVLTMQLQAVLCASLATWKPLLHSCWLGVLLRHHHHQQQQWKGGKQHPQQQKRQWQGKVGMKVPQQEGTQQQQRQQVRPAAVDETQTSLRRDKEGRPMKQQQLLLLLALQWRQRNPGRVQVQGMVEEVVVRQLRRIVVGFRQRRASLRMPQRRRTRRRRSMMMSMKRKMRMR